MELGTQDEVSLDRMLDVVVDKIGEENLSFYHPSRDWVLEKVEPSAETLDASI